MSRTYPAYAIAAVGAIVISEGRILLVKRNAEPGRGLWSIPGGAIEPGESIYEAARRELVEETGVDALPLGIIGIVNVVVKDSSNRTRYHYVILDVLFDEKSIRGVLRPGGDALDVAFIPIEQAVDNASVSRTTRALLRKIVHSKSNAVLEVNEILTIE
uniref:NUDIX domain-containing protein n=1 Tax=Ignisphaera aggregans TaxID=334771 RepID=A0A7C2V9T7_9CREN